MNSIKIYINFNNTFWGEGGLEKEKNRLLIVSNYFLKTFIAVLTYYERKRPGSGEEGMELQNKFMFT